MEFVVASISFSLIIESKAAPPGPLFHAPSLVRVHIVSLMMIVSDARLPSLSITMCRRSGGTISDVNCILLSLVSTSVSVRLGPAVSCDLIALITTVFGSPTGRTGAAGWVATGAAVAAGALGAGGAGAAVAAGGGGLGLGAAGGGRFFYKYCGCGRRAWGGLRGCRVL